MSVLIFVILTLGYVHISETKEQLSLTDFLLDFLLSLWVPPNYTPSKLARSIPDPLAKEQMISIEKSKIALDNYINHLLKYADENNYVNKKEKTNGLEAQPSSLISNSAPCNDPFHNQYYPSFGNSMDDIEGHGIIEPPDNFPNMIYDGKTAPSNIFPIYDTSIQQGAIDRGNGIPSVNMCPSSGTLLPLYPYGCQTKRNIRWDDVPSNKYVPYPDVNENSMYKFAKRIWYLHHDSPKNLKIKEILNRFYGAGVPRPRLPPLISELPEVPSLIAPRPSSYNDQIMSAQEKIKKRVAPPQKDTQALETRIFEEFYLPGFLDELASHPHLQQFTYPFYNYPFKNYGNYYDTIAKDVVVANRMLDTKLRAQGGRLNAMTYGVDHQKTTAAPIAEPAKRLEKKSENNSDLPTPTHRFGEVQSDTTKTEKDFVLGHVLKAAEDKPR